MKRGGIIPLGVAVTVSEAWATGPGITGRGLPEGGV